MARSVNLAAKSIVCFCCNKFITNLAHSFVPPGCNPLVKNFLCLFATERGVSVFLVLCSVCVRVFIRTIPITWPKILGLEWDQVTAYLMMTTTMSFGSSNMILKKIEIDLSLFFSFVFVFVKYFKPHRTFFNKYLEIHLRFFLNLQRTMLFFFSFQASKGLGVSTAVFVFKYFMS